MNSLSPLKDMLRAYYPVIYVTSFEYTKTIQQVRNIIRETSSDYTLYYWNFIDGLSQCPISDTKKVSKFEDMEEPTELLKYIESRTSDGSFEVYMLEDFHEYMEEMEVKIRLRKLAEKPRYYHKHIIIVPPLLNLPAE